MPVVVACLPFLATYPLAISLVTRSLAGKVVRQNKQLQELSRTDGLTGLVNREQCFAVAAQELARHFRTARPATLLIVDVDRFKTINDRYGHPVGDDVLRRVAESLRQSCRIVDTAARYGGDEFILVLPEANLREAEITAQRVRRNVESLVFEQAPDLRCTLSIGAAEAEGDITTVEDWIRRADAALYRAKSAGRNRFEAASA